MSKHTFGLNETKTSAYKLTYLRQAVRHSAHRTQLSTAHPLHKGCHPEANMIPALCIANCS